MTPRGRRWLISAAALVALVIAGFAFALYRLNDYLQDHRDALAVQASAALGRAVRFGTLGVSLRRGLSARVTDLHVGEDPRFGDGDFLSAQEVFVAIDPLPALVGRYHLRRILLDAPTITVILTASGSNIDTLGQPPGSAPPPPRSPQAPASSEPRAAVDLVPLLIASATVRNGRIDLIDRRRTPPSAVRVDRLDVSATDVSPDRPIRFELRAALLDAADPNVVVGGTFDPRPPGPLDVRVALGPVPIDRLRSLPGLEDLIPAALTSSDPFSVTLRLGGTREALTVALDVDLSAAAVRYGALLSKPSGTALTLTAEAESTALGAHVDVRVAQLTIGDAVLRGRGRVDTSPAPMLDATVELAPASLAALAALLPSFAPYTVEGTMAATLQASGRLAGDRLPGLSGRVELHDAGVTGAPLPVRGFSGAIEIGDDRAVLPATMLQVGGMPIGLACTAMPLRAPVVTCTATADRLSPSASGLHGVAATDALTAVRASATVQPGAAVHAEVSSQSGMLHGAAYRDLQVTARVDSNGLTVDQLAVAAFDGSVRGSGSVRTPAGGPPEFEGRATVDDIRLTPLLASQGVADAQRLDGRVRGNVTLAGSGRDWPSIRQTLRGNGRAQISDGVVRNVNLAEQVLNGLGGFGALTQLVSPRARERHPGIFSGGDTRFDALGASVRVADGRAVTDDARLRSADFDVDGRGTVGLDGRLDLRGTLTASAVLTRDLIGGIREARGLTNRDGRLEVPFTVRGTVSDVRVQPDRDFVAGALQRSLVDQGLNSLLGTSEKKDGSGKKAKSAEQLLEKGLKQLLGR